MFDPGHSTIQEIWVLDRNGVVQFNLRLEDAFVHQEVVGGFLAAMNNFKSELDVEGRITNINIGAFRLSMISFGEGNMILAARSRQDSKEKRVTKALRKLRSQIYDYFKTRTPPEEGKYGVIFEFDDDLSNIFFEML